MSRKDSLDEEVPATLGGDGWCEREQSHRQEVAEGLLWASYRQASQYNPLKAVLLAEPGSELAVGSAFNEALMFAPVDVVRIKEQFDGIVDFFESRGVTVHAYRPTPAPSANWIFQADLFFMTPEGAILARPAAAQRAGEERIAQAELARLGIPIRASMYGRATFEGADAQWLDEKTVLVGVGRRTNGFGADLVEATLQAQGVNAERVEVPGESQHLMGVVMRIDRDLALVHGGCEHEQVLKVLNARAIQAVVLPPDDELVLRRGMNLVVLGPREVVLPSGCPGIRRRLDALGVVSHELEIGEYINAAGGLGCLTGILSRAAT